MTSANNILDNIAHRPYPLPEGHWRYYQEWNHTIFLHYKVPFDILRPLVPTNLPLDIFNGECYVSVVPFTMQKIRPRFLPSLNMISDFDEINVRTYIDHDGKQGVYFLNIEAGKAISAYISKKLSGLPYEKANTIRNKNNYRSVNNTKGFKLEILFRIGEELIEKTAIDRWLTERYCLFLDNEKGSFRYDIHHAEWKLRSIEIDQLRCVYRIGNLNLEGVKPDKIHYSDGVKVIAWKKKKL